MLLSPMDALVMPGGVGYMAVSRPESPSNDDLGKFISDRDDAQPGWLRMHEKLPARFQRAVVSNAHSREFFTCLMRQAREQTNREPRVVLYGRLPFVA